MNKLKFWKRQTKRNDSKQFDTKYNNKKFLVNKKKTNATVQSFNYINSITRIELHYLRAQMSTEFIEGSKSLADLQRDSVKITKL